MGEHFNLPGHQFSDMRVPVLEEIRNNTLYRKQREQMWIHEIMIANYKKSTETPVLSTKFEPYATV